MGRTSFANVGLAEPAALTAIAAPKIPSAIKGDFMLNRIALWREAIVLSQRLPERIVREGFDAVAVDAGHRLACDQCVDDGFLGRLHGRLEQGADAGV